MSGLVPNRFLVDFELPLRPWSSPTSAFGNPKRWGDGHVLPALCLLDGVQPFGSVSMAWSEDGLFVSASVTGKRRALVCDPDRFWKSDHLRLCIDSRDTRTIKRATRYCHQFYLLPTGAGPKKDRPVAASHKIQRARDDAPTVKPGRIKVKSVIHRDGYWMGAHIPADCLNGFDPAEHAR
ncbi:MAG: hypothetical protein ACE5GE_13280, partial [Phycisphaerae bacterium]